MKKIVDQQSNELSANELRTVIGGVTAILIDVGPTRMDESASLKMLGQSTIGSTVLDAFNALAAAAGRTPR